MEKVRDGSLFLSKSLFMKGRQCLKALYLQKKDPELASPPTPEKEELFRLGREFGQAAWNLFPGGIEIAYNPSDYPGQVRKTKEALKSAKAIFEGALSHENIFIKADILERAGQGWSLHEVKMTTEIEDQHVYDAGIQYYVSNGAGLDIQKTTIVHVNRDYVRNGPLEPEVLFKIENVTERVRDIQPIILEELQKQRKMLIGEIPVIDIGRQCSEPYLCDFEHHCWSHIPELSVFNLRGRGVDKFEMYRKGLIRFEDLPLHLLSSDQRLHVRTTLSQEDVIHVNRVRAFLDRLSYPICYFDFETIALPIPPFDGTRPYQTIPFQYCIYIQENEWSEPVLREYLANPGDDPRRDFIDKFLRDIPEKGCLVVFNESFEKRVLRYLKEWFPAYAERIDRVLDSIIDLMEPFRDRDLYFWKMNGSYSLKSILPALFPEMSYDRLAISEGTEASRMYLYMNRCNDQVELEKIKNDLLEYCRQDTYALFKIVERMWSLI